MYLLIFLWQDFWLDGRRGNLARRGLCDTLPVPLFQQRYKQNKQKSRPDTPTEI